MARLRALLIDLSGTLHVGDTPTRGAAEALHSLRTAGLALRFVSNTSKESRTSLLRKLAKMKIDVREEELFTSLSAAADLVRKRSLRCATAILSMKLVETTFRLPRLPSIASLSASHLPPLSTAINEAFRLLSGEEGGHTKGTVPLIVTHRARYFGDSDGKLSLGPGPFITALEEASGARAEIGKWLGKPEKAFFQLALDSLAELELKPAEIGMIGDDVQQDVGAAVADLGLRRFLVQTGKYREGDEETCAAGRPDWVGQDFATAVEAILRRDA